MKAAIPIRDLPPAPIGSEVQPMDSRCYRAIKDRLAGTPKPFVWTANPTKALPSDAGTMC